MTTPRELDQPPSYSVGSVDAALKLLLAVKDHRTMSVTEAAAELGVAKSTAHRLLDTLRYRGFVTQSTASKRYELGDAALELGGDSSVPVDIRLQARPVIERLSQTTGETVHLVALRGTQVLFLDGVEGSQPLRIGVRIGWSTFAHLTSAGKALLAQYTDAQLRLLYPEDELQSLTEASVRTFPDLMRQLAAVRTSGSAISINETGDGVTAIAVAVTKPSAVHRVAISLSVPTSRMGERQLTRLALAIDDAATGLRVSSNSFPTSSGTN